MQFILDYIKKHSKSKFVRNLSVTFLENIVTKILNFVITLVLIRHLPPEEFGKYSFIYASIILLSSTLDFGMENTAVRFSSKEKDKTNSIFGLYMSIKMLILLIFIAILVIFGADLLGFIKKDNLAIYIPFIILALLGESLLFIDNTFLQACQKFNFRTILNISRYSIGFAFIMVLMWANHLSLQNILWIYLVPFTLSLIFLPKYIKFFVSFIKEKFNKKFLLEIFNYEKNIMALSVINNVSTRIDFFMLSIWVGYTDIGIYNAAYQLTQIVQFLPYTLGKVILPKISEMPREEIFKFVKKLNKPIWILSVIILVFIPIVVPLVPLLLGAEYKGTTGVLGFLLAAFVAAFLGMPLEQAMYGLGKPQYINFSRIVQLIVTVILNVLTIPYFGMIWAAINVLIARVIFYLILLFLFNKEKNLVLLNKKALVCDENYGEAI